MSEYSRKGYFLYDILRMFSRRPENVSIYVLNSQCIECLVGSVGGIDAMLTLHVNYKCNVTRKLQVVTYKACNNHI